VSFAKDDEAEAPGAAEEGAAFRQTTGAVLEKVPLACAVKNARS